jgi:hypothetical protein
MGWKNWSYWVKGGVIGLVVLIILVAIEMFYCPEFVKLGYSKQSICSLVRSVGFDFGGGSTVSWTIFFVSFLLIGALIGFIYGKIKQRGKRNG